MVSFKTGMAGRKGALGIEEGALVFRPDSRRHGDTRITLQEITRVRRVRGSPVLELRVSSAIHPERIGFYFIKPPSLDPPEGFHLRPDRAAKKIAAQTLRGSNTMLKDRIDVWVRAIEEARLAAGSGGG